MQILTDLSEVLNVGGNSIVPQSITQATAGSSVNLQNGEVMTGCVVDLGAISAGITTATIQVEEWSGTTLANGPGAVPGNGATTWQAIPNMVTTFTTTNPGALTLIGLRTQGYARVNVVTYNSQTAGMLISSRIFSMPKSSAGATATGYSRSPSA